MARNHVVFASLKDVITQAKFKLQFHYCYDVRPCVEMEQVTSMFAVVKKRHILIKEEVS